MRKFKKLYQSVTTFGENGMGEFCIELERYRHTYCTVLYHGIGLLEWNIFV